KRSEAVDDGAQLGRVPPARRELKIAAISGFCLLILPAILADAAQDDVRVRQIGIDRDGLAGELAGPARLAAVQLGLGEQGERLRRAWRGGDGGPAAGQ